MVWVMKVQKLLSRARAGREGKTSSARGTDGVHVICDEQWWGVGGAYRLACRAVR